jgi:16S rRNA (cytosine967-C5)-methyltransferase
VASEDDQRRLAVQMVAGGRLRALVLELWQRTRMDWGFVSDRLAVTFRHEKWLGAHDRRFVSELLYALVRDLRRVDLALERGRRGAGKPAPRDSERVLAACVLQGWLEPARAAEAVPEIDWTAVARIDDAIARVRDPVQRIALAASLPDWLAARLVAEWGADAEALARALDQRAPMTVRANLLVVAGRDALAAELAREGELATHPGALVDTALVVDTRVNLFATAAFQRGAFEAQDEGSQMLADVVVECLGAARAAAHDRPPLVIDYCAGAGGKTLAIAARLGNRGRIVSTDVDSDKLEKLRKRARRATVSNTRALHVDAPELDRMAGKADVVLVDAPCSGTGALRRNPEARWRLRETDLAELAAKQREILARAMRFVAPGGRLVYATCSLLRAENQDIASRYPAVALSHVLGEHRAQSLGDGEDLVLTPHRHGTDGFFARVLEPSI